MTSTGLLMIPLALLTVLLPWRYSIMALVVFATMDSAAVVNVGSFGLQPGYFMGLVIIGRTAIEIALYRTPLNAKILRAMLPLLLFAVVCIFSVWIGLTFFQGQVMIVSSTDGVNLDLAQPYTFQRQNLTQPFYLFLNILVLYAVAHQMARLPPGDVARTVDRAILGAIVFAAGVAIWEMADFYAGVPFAESFFHSNAGYATAYGQVLSGAVLRTSGPFTEPAALAYHFAGFLLYAWYRYLRWSSTGAMFVVLLCVAIMAASTSTTAFAMLGIFALVAVKDLAVVGATSGAQTKLSIHHVGAVALIGVAAVAAFFFIQEHWRYVDEVLTAMVFEKSQSGSFEQRTGVDRMAVDIVLQTGGIGVGLGSHKPNNLAMTLLSNTGIIGFATFAVFLFDVIRPPAQTHRRADLKPLRWLIIGLLLVHVMANPNLSTMILWIGCALIVGVRCQQLAPIPAAGPPRELRGRGALARVPGP